MPSLKKMRSGKAPKIDFLELGPGRNKGPAFLAAEALESKGHKRNIVTVGYARPEQPLPQNLNVIRMGIIHYLESVPPESVRNIREDFVFHQVGIVEGQGLIKGLERALRELKKVRQAHLSEKAVGRIASLDVSTKYLRLVKQALIPGGNFIVTTFPEKVQEISLKLIEQGFIVSMRKMTPEQIRKSGSDQAVWDLEKGGTVYRILAKKPKR